jgi:hypothetical protein
MTATSAEIISFDVAVGAEIRREAAKAKARFGNAFEVMCLE